MGIGAIIAGTAAALATGGLSIMSSHKEAKAIKSAAETQAKAQEAAAAQEAAEMNKQSQKQPDVETILENNAGSDTGSTLLTGAGGVDPNSLRLGKGSTLLGG